MKRRVTHLLYTCVLLFLACQSQIKTEYESLTFSINPDMLGTVFADSASGIQFSPPADWTPLDETTLANTNSSITDNYPPGNITYTVIYFAIDAARKNFCSLSRITFDDIQDIPSTIDNMIRGKYPEGEVKFGKVMINTIKCIQYRVVTDKQILYKLFLTADRPAETVQIDYALPRPVSGSLLEFVESSIGSIQAIEKQREE